MQIDLIILDKTYNAVTYIDMYHSLLWNIKYNDVGDFEFVVKASSKNMKNLKLGYFVVRNDDNYVGIIEKIVLEETENNGRIMIVSGQFLESLLERRVCYQQSKLKGTVSSTGKILIDNNFRKPKEKSRAIENFRYSKSELEVDGEVKDLQINGAYVLDVIKNIALNNNLGFKITLSNGKFVFKYFKGEDKRKISKNTEWIVFSESEGNLISFNYQKTLHNKITHVLVRGNKHIDNNNKAVSEWVSRKTENANDNNLSRFEAFCDARNIQCDENDTSLANYKTELRAEANKILDESKNTEDVFQFEIKVKENSFRNDYYIGDMVSVECESFSKILSCRIVEALESLNDLGEYNVDLTLAVIGEEDDSK